MTETSEQSVLEENLIYMFSFFGLLLVTLGVSVGATYLVATRLPAIDTYASLVLVAVTGPTVAFLFGWFGHMKLSPYLPDWR